MADPAASGRLIPGPPGWAYWVLPTSRSSAVSRRPLLLLLVAVFSVSLAPPAGAGADDSTGLGSLEPGSGPPGTTISYTVVGSPSADSECRGSSAFATELLDATGVR